MNRNAIALAVTSAFALMGTAIEAQASGFALHEQGISGLGNAYAGAAAVAEDASTVWWNPAGMSRLGAGKHFSIGGALIVPKTEFTNGSSAAGFGGRPLGGNGGDAGGPALVPSAFFAMGLNDKLSFGIGVNVPFGLATKYDSNWMGRFQGIESEVMTVNINPSVSYKISDAASIGAGLSYQYGKIDLLTGVNFGAGEGTSKVEIDGDGWGVNIGGLFNLGSATRVGVHYRSAIKYNLEGSLKFSGVPAGAGGVDGDVKLDLKTPDSFAFSVVHDLNDKWQLLGDATFTKWSKIQRIPLIRSSTGTTVDTLIFDFDDTWRVSAGANYKMNSAWTLKAGVAFDQSPVPSAEARTVRLPDNDRTWLSVGAKYHLSRASAVDMGYTFIKVKDAAINNTPATTPAPGLRGTVNGNYEGHVHILGVQYQQTF